MESERALRTSSRKAALLSVRPQAAQCATMSCSSEASCPLANGDALPSMLRVGVCMCMLRVGLAGRRSRPPTPPRAAVHTEPIGMHAGRSPRPVTPFLVPLRKMRRRPYSPSRHLPLYAPLSVPVDPRSGCPWQVGPTTLVVRADESRGAADDWAFRSPPQTRATARSAAKH